MDGAFDWGNYTKSASKGGELPKHIERMDRGTRPPEMKNSGSGSNLPWGGKPSEQAKAYMQGTPKNKGSMLSKTGATKAPTAKPQGGGKALQGHKVTQPSSSVSGVKTKKGK